MKTSLTVQERTQLENWKTKEGMPVFLAEVLTPAIPELGKVSIIHPTTNDPVVVSEHLGPVAIWFDF